jgi:hypothetical protein
MLKDEAIIIEPEGSLPTVWFNFRIEPGLDPSFLQRTQSPRSCKTWPSRVQFYRTAMATAHGFDTTPTCLAPFE